MLAVRIDAPLYLANSAFLKSSVAALDTESDVAPRALVIDAPALGSVDSAGAETLFEMFEDYRDRGLAVMLAAVRGPVLDTLRAADLFSILFGPPIAGHFLAMPFPRMWRRQ